MTEESFASLAHRKVIGSREPSVRSIAHAMGMKEHSLYARLYDRTPFSAEELRLFFSIVPDPDLANYLFAGSKLIAVERAALSENAADSLHRGALKTLLDATDIVRATEVALLDGRLDHREKAEILRQVVETERALASLHQLLRQLP